MATCCTAHPSQILHCLLPISGLLVAMCGMAAAVADRAHTWLQDMWTVEGLNLMTRDRLREVCQEQGVYSIGTKAEIVERLLDKHAADQGQPGPLPVSHACCQSHPS